MSTPVFKWVYPIIVALCMTCLLPLSAWAGSISKDLETALEALDPDEEVSIIAVLADRPKLSGLEMHQYKGHRPQLIRSLRSHAELSQSDLRGFLSTERVKRQIPLWIINGMAISAPAEVVRRLAHLPSVETIKLDRTIPLVEGPVGAPAQTEWNVSSIGAPDLWNLGHKGAFAVVAAMDSGADPAHPDLKGRYRGGLNSWYDPHGQHATPFDANGHGTQVMGVMVGGTGGGSAIGVAPEASWIAVKIFNDAGIASLSAIHQGFQWLLDPDGDPDTDDAPDVVNNSWGFVEDLNECVAEFQPDLQALRAANIGVVFAAGNSGPLPSTSISPANLPESFSVGVLDADTFVTPYSSRGPAPCDSAVFPELVAPGDGIRTADLSFGGLVPDPYTTVSGSSFAAPHVAGAMALLKSAFPTVDLPRLETALKVSAWDLGVVGPDNEYGYGALDVMEAYLYLASNPGTDTIAPSIHSASASPNPTSGATVVEITALADDSGSGGSNIVAAEWWEGATAPAPGAASPLGPQDGSFDSPKEELVGKINIAGWALGGHNIFVRCRDEAGNWSTPSLVQLNITRKPKDLVEITHIEYTRGKTLTVWATSTAPGGSVTLTAYSRFRGIGKKIGTLQHRADTGDYRGTFTGVSRKPKEVLVVSSGGGRDTNPIR
jgi:serine protease AprX